MVITRKTLITELLKVEKDAVIRQLTKLNPNFSRLKNPVFRNTIARMVTIEAACKVAGAEVPLFLDAMKQIGFVVEDQINEIESPDQQTSGIPKANCQELDVRPVLANKQDPIKIILRHIDALGENETLKLIAPFEPVPLIHMLSVKGYNYEVQQEGGSVITYFWKDPNAIPKKSAAAGKLPETSEADFESLLSRYEGHMRTIDVRNLEMPQPMIMILENLQELQEHEALFVHHKKLPVYLLPHLRERGYAHSTQPTADGKMNLIIYKP